MKSLDIRGDTFHPEWNYTIMPQTQNWLEGDGKMRRQITVFLSVFGFMMMFSHAIAQQNTVRACREILL
jgi:hypothetical protein